MAVRSAPDEQLPVGCGGRGVVGASGDGGDCISIEYQCWDPGGGEYHGLIAVGTISDACCPKAIQAPCPDIFLVLLNGKGMAHAAADKPAIFVQTEGSWEKGIVTLALENAMAELILLVRSPDEYCAILSKSHGMICAASHLLHTTEIWELGRGRLDP